MYEMAFSSMSSASSAFPCAWCTYDRDSSASTWYACCGKASGPHVVSQQPILRAYDHGNQGLPWRSSASAPIRTCCSTMTMLFGSAVWAHSSYRLCRAPYDGPCTKRNVLVVASESPDLTTSIDRRGCTGGQWSLGCTKTPRRSAPRARPRPRPSCRPPRPDDPASASDTALAPKMRFSSCRGFARLSSARHRMGWPHAATARCSAVPHLIGLQQGRVDGEHILGLLRVLPRGAFGGRHWRHGRDQLDLPQRPVHIV